MDAFNTKSESDAMIELARLEIVLGNIEGGRFILKQLLNTKSSPYALLEIANLEIMQGNIEDAMSYISQLTDQDFLVSKTLLLIKIFIIGEDYLKALEALEYIDKIPTKDISDRSVLIQSHFYIKNKMGLISNVSETTGYLCEQMFSYSDSKAIHHIRNHLFKRNGKTIHSIFKPDIDINALFKKAKEEKGNYEILFDGYIDYYIMDVGYNIGTWKDSETTKVKVATIHNTDNIITIYPYINEYNVRRVNNKRNNLTLK